MKGKKKRNKIRGKGKKRERERERERDEEERRTNRRIVISCPLLLQHLSIFPTWEARKKSSTMWVAGKKTMGNVSISSRHNATFEMRGEGE